MVPTCPRRSPFSGSSSISATTSNSFMSESPQNVAARQARKVLICKHDPSGTHQRSASRMLERKIYHITMTESVNFASNGILIAGRRQQPLLQHTAVGRADSQHCAKERALYGDLPDEPHSNNNRAISRFRPPLSCHWAASRFKQLSVFQAPSKQGGRHAPRTAACHRHAGRADALVTQLCRLRIGSDAEIWRRPRLG